MGFVTSLFLERFFNPLLASSYCTKNQIPSLSSNVGPYEHELYENATSAINMRLPMEHAVLVFP